VAYMTRCVVRRGRRCQVSVMWLRTL